MKLWRITFTGIWPVGAAAVVCTTDHHNEDDAIRLFRNAWHLLHSQADPEPVRATVIDGSPGCVHILCDGNY